MERYTEAENALRRVVVLKADDIGAHYLLSITHERQGKLADAILEAVAVCKLDPRNEDRPDRVLALARRFARVRAEV
jgi:cytochrome c-type biogenesis protein CcmH/NrfG